MTIAPTFFAAGALFAAAAGTSITPVIPASCVANDIMVFVGMCNVAATLTKPADYTSFTGSPSNNANQSIMACWKRHTGTESNPTASSSTTGSATAGLYGRLYVFRGCLASGDPFDSQAIVPPISSNTPSLSVSFNPSNDCLAVGIALVDDDNTWSSGMPPSGWANIGGILSSTTGGDAMIDAIAKTLTTGSALTDNVGVMSAADFWATLGFTLKPIPDGRLIITGPSTAVNRAANW